MNISYMLEVFRHKTTTQGGVKNMTNYLNYLNSNIIFQNLEKVRHVRFTEQFHPLCFLLYINNLPKCTNNIEKSYKTKLILFIDKISLIVSSSKPSEFIKDIDIIFTKLKNWFKANLLSLSFEKKI
jgi:hypothetical protein